jgi:cell division protein FtsZ
LENKNVIEFKHDGPFAGKANQLFPDRVRIIGLGQTGAAVCDQLVLHGRSLSDLSVYDSDQQTIESSVAPNRHLLGGDVVHGLGCSGDLDLAREIVALEEERLTHLAHGCDFLILILGLAGSTGVALAEHIIQLGHRTGAKVLVVGAQPFAFEGASRREKSIQAIDALRREADSVLVLSQDRIVEDPTLVKNARHGFYLMHQLLAQAAQALAQVVCKRGLIQLSFADVRSLYGRYTGSEVLENCWAAHVEGDMHDCTEDLIQQLLDCPMVSNEAIWKHVDHAIVAVSGTRDLGLSDVQEMVGALKERFPSNIPIATSASLDEESHGKVRMTILLAMTTPAEASPAEKSPGKKHSSASAHHLAKTVALPEIEARLAPPMTDKSKPPRSPASPRKSKSAPNVVQNDAVAETGPLPVLEPEMDIPRVIPEKVQPGQRFLAKQEEMQFEGPTRGRFEKTHETMYRGENLDQPTFRRRRLTIKL